MAWSWKAFCATCGTITACVCAVVTAPVTAPIAAATALTYAALGGAVGYFVGDVADKENIEKEKRLMENERYRDAKADRDTEKKKLENNQNLLIELIGKRNGNLPRKEGETDQALDDLIAVITNNIKNGENRLSELDKELERLRKMLSSKGLLGLLGLDKLKNMDKIMIAGGIVLIIYLLKK